MCSLSAEELNTLLIPTSLLALTQEAQYTELSANTPESASLRCLLHAFFYKIASAKKYEMVGKASCHYTIPWTIESTLTLSGICMSNYYDYAISHSTSGFAYLLYANLQIIKNELKYKHMYLDGKVAPCFTYPTCQ